MAETSTARGPKPATITEEQLKQFEMSDYTRITKARTSMDFVFERFKPLARELAENFDPHRWYEFFEDNDAQEAAMAKILNGVPGQALDAAVAGIFSSATPATQQWILFKTGNKQLEQIWEVAQWLHDFTDDVEAVLQDSNFYAQFPLCLRDFIVQPGGCFFIEPDANEVFRIKPFRFGQYRVAVDKNGYPTQWSMTDRMTVRQIIEAFGKRVDVGDGKTELSTENLSETVVNYILDRNFDAEIDIILFVGPNNEYDPSMLAAKYNKWALWYYEGSVPIQGNNPENENKFLWKTGYDYFPVVFFPWETNGKDPYATNNLAKRALPDTKELYFLEKMYMTILELVGNPPTIKHPDMQEVDMLPGGQTDAPEGVDAEKAVATLYKQSFDFAHLEQRIEKKELMVTRHFMADFFRMLLDSEGKAVQTATYWLEKKKEVMVLLGTAFGQLTKFGLEPFINIVVHLMRKQGKIRPAPAVMKDVVMNVKFVSVIAKALRMADLSSVQAGRDFVEGLDPEKDSISKAVDEYEMVKYYFEILDLPTKLITPEDVYKKMLENDAKARAAEAQAKMMPAAAGAAKNLSEADPSSGVLGRMTGMATTGSGAGVS